MSSKKKVITLRSSDGEIFEVEEAVALEWLTIKPLVESGCTDAIPLPQVTGNILAKVIEYCKKHIGASESEDRKILYELESWDADFIKVDQGTLFDLIRAADYLTIKTLFEFTCQTVADTIKHKTIEEVRHIFRESNDFTPEEEKEIRGKSWWLQGL
ncbi:hypothetical protein MLD38_030712 [Melastoma candidum]|uniref:Uncharacterized protein n=1 Tax=Melastoma candidum TaxID=119954 RepID=A0ACB9MM67_9MYRT|nr:hypothetical protein MLD38_030712 [Melastoma candidum]